MIYEFIIAFAMYFAILYVSYYLTEKRRLPWLQFSPFKCRKCFAFWANLISAFVVGLSFNLYITMSTVLVMGVLTAIAMHVDEKNNTLTIEEYEKLINKN